MKAYVICVIATISFALLSDKALKNKKMKLGKILLTISFLIPCLIAGIRSEYVGTDVHTYLKGLYIDFLNNSANPISAVFSHNIEPGFCLLVYISTFFKSLNFTMFMVSFVSILPIYIFAYKNRYKINIFIIISIFMLSMFCISLSMMRQSIAMSFIILGTYYYIENNKKYAYLNLIIAFLFHYSSIVGIIIYYVINTIRKAKYNKLFIAFNLVIVFALFVTIIYSFLPYLGIKYSSYLINHTSSSFKLLSLAKKIFWLVPIFISIGRCKFNKYYLDILIISFVFIFFDIVLYIFGIKLAILPRLGLYFMNVSLFMFFPIFIKAFKQRYISSFIVILILFMIWWNMTAVENDTSGVYPYKTDIIDFLN